MTRRHEKINRIRLNGARCVYCGEIATTDEHFPPYCVNPVSGFILPSCSECNAIASNKHAYNFKNRVEYVKAKIRKHNKDVLHLPTWHKEEIRALGGNLKRMVAYGSLQQAKAKRRIDFETVAYLVQIDKDERFLRYAGYIPQDCFSVEDVFEPSATVNKPTIKKQKAAPVVIEKKKEKVKTVRELQEGEVKHNYVGVIFSKGEYRAGIYEDGSRKIIGSFKTPQEALEARRAYLKLDISSASLYYDR